VGLIPIHCQYARLMPVDQLKPHPRNPNRHPEEQVRRLAKNIQQLGWRHPIIVSSRSGLIIVGHARLLAAQQLKLDEVPVDDQTFASEQEELTFLLADNRLPELAETDNRLLKDVLQELDVGLIDMELTGFDEHDLEELMTAAPPIEAEEIECPKCGYRWSKDSIT